MTLLAVLAGVAIGTAFAAPYAAFVMDARTGEVLYSKNATTRLHPASLTKMMTLYIAFGEIRSGRLSLDSMITVSKNAANQAPSRLGLREGQKIALRYLIRAAAIKSANDAAAAIGDAIGGSPAGFAKKMNRTAKSIGMTDSTFRNANGLTEAGHLSTARDMSVLGRRLFYDYPEFYNIFSRRTTDAGMSLVANTNRKFLDSYEGADGIKTGYTVPAGFNLTASAQRGNVRIIATIFGGLSTAQRNSKMAELLDLGFAKAPANAQGANPGAPAIDVENALIASANIPDEEEQVAQDGSADTQNMAMAASPRPKARSDTVGSGIEVAVAEAVVDEAMVNAMQSGIAGALAEATTPPPANTLEAQSVALAEAPAQTDIAPGVDASAAVDVALAEAAISAPVPGTLDAQSQALAAAETAPAADTVALQPTELAALPAPDNANALSTQAAVLPAAARNAPRARPALPAAEPEVAIATAKADAPAVPVEIVATAAMAAVEPDVVSVVSPDTAQIAMAATLVRPAKRNAPNFDQVAVAPEAVAVEQEVVTRLSTSGGRYWGVNVGRFNTSYDAESTLLKIQLTESATLNDGLRKVIRKSGAFDANFMGLSQEQADLACRRLQARAVECVTIGPQT